PRHRRLLRARQGGAGEDHRPRPPGPAEEEAFGAAGPQIDCAPMNALAPLVAAVLLAAADPGGAASLLEKGERLFREGDTAGALAAFTEAASADPRDARPHYLKGVALEKKGDAAAATAEYKRAIQLQPQMAEAHNNLGAILLARGDAAGAATELEA